MVQHTGTTRATADASEGDSAAARPNVVIILADDLGFSDVGCYGSEIPTPAIDTLAASGHRFSQMYNSGRCCPSRAALLTGMNPHQAGIGHMTYTPPMENSAYQGYLSDSCATIAELFQDAGYRTLMSGKWHVARQRPMANRSAWPDDRPAYPLPRERGFDEFYGTIGGGGSYFKPTYLMDNDTLVEQDDPSWFYTDAITDRAIDMATGSVDQGMPFFLYVAYTAPHWPLHAPEEEVARFDGAYRSGWDEVRASRHEELRARGILDPGWKLSDRDNEAWQWDETQFRDWEAHRMAVYAAQISQMDTGIGRIVDTLKAQGQFENTLILFMSDNGGCAEFLAEDGGILDVEPGTFARTTPGGRPVHFGNTPEVAPGGPDTFQSYGPCWANASNSPFRNFKRWVHEGGISTPLVIHWPEGVPGGGIVHGPAHIIDILPTCLEAAGIPYPTEYRDRELQPLEGESLMPSLRNPNWSRSRSIFFEHEGNRALRAGEWKLVSAEDGPWELYNITEDRTETNDLAAREPGRREAMANDWHRWAKRMGVNLSLREDLAELLAAERNFTMPSLRKEL